MFIGKVLASVVVALGLAFGATGTASSEAAHGHDAVQLRLDNGKKWQTDDVLRRGMSEIRSAMAASLAPIHENAFTPAQYDALAARIQAQIDYIVGNCKLPEEADQQLHLVLEQIIDGVAEMKAPADGARGAVKIVQALGAYGTYFDHAGWQPLAH